MIEYMRDIPVRAFPGNCERAGNIKLATGDVASFMNIYAWGIDTIHADDARALRDALIEAYPLEETALVPSAYRVRQAKSSPWKWLVERDEPRSPEPQPSSHHTVVFATTDTAERAVAIADALNAQGAA